MRRSANSDAVERRLWKDHPRARRIVAAAAGLSVAAAVSWVAFALLLSVVIRGPASAATNSMTAAPIST